MILFLLSLTSTSMKITIRPLQKGKATFEVEAEPSETIGELKLKISTKHNYPVESQNIIDSGKALQDDKTISSYNIKEASPLTLVLKGAPAEPTSTASCKVSRIASALPIGAARPALASQQGGPPFNRSDMSSGVRPSQALVDKIMGMGLGHTREQIMQALANSDSSALLDQMLFDVVPVSSVTRPAATGSSFGVPNPLTNSPYPTPHPGASAPVFSPTLHPSMQQKQQQWNDPSYMSLAESAFAGLSTPASGSAPKKVVIREEKKL